MLAQSVLFLKFNGEQNYTNSSELRGSISELLRRTVNEFSNIYGAFVAFAPDGLDGEDSNYHGADYVGANDKGRFSPYWLKSGSGEAENSADMGQRLTRLSQHQQELAGQFKV